MFRKPYHPHIERSLEVLKDQFIDVVIREQDPWRHEDRYEDLARAVPDYRLSNALIKYWKTTTDRSSADKWLDVDKYYQNLKIQSFDLQDWKKEMIFKTMYPRLDVEVSRQMIHLLKSPFCVHPGTGNVCIPFDPSKEKFNPLTAPNLQTLFNEDEEHVENTSLQPSIDLFNKYVRDLMKEELTKKRTRDESKESLEF
ncbi:unnamed protein product [Ambrosiozyma monospora]|uniref:Unnamed protein product n=1 Tax=Ambrosiozyma monospora TaxID=43982 RepID=A0A9W6T850_AMBMO|nr:unnamed protein product [Ambrosiozyma monospora]